jgi:hypothetical protein
MVVVILCSHPPQNKVWSENTDFFFFWEPPASQNFAFQIQITSVPTVNFPNHFGKKRRIWRNRSSHTGTYEEFFSMPARFWKVHFPNPNQNPKLFLTISSKSICYLEWSLNWARIRFPSVPQYVFELTRWVWGVWGVRCDTSMGESRGGALLDFRCYCLTD